MRVFTIIVFLLLSSCFTQLNAQTHDEIALLKSSFEFQSHQPSNTYFRESNSFVELIANQLFLFYKVFLSSQDYSSCSFHPSCSVYAIESIQKQTGLSGIIDAFDRLTRCNGMSPEHYPINRELHLLEDPVRNIKYEKLP